MMAHALMRWTVLIGATILAGCTTAADRARLETSALRAEAHAQMPARLDALQDAQTQCEPLRRQPQNGWTAAADCYNQRLIKAFDAADPPYRAALYTNIAQRQAGAAQVDRGLITPAQARARMLEQDRGAVAAFRLLTKPPPMTPLQQEHSREMAVHDELVQRQQDTDTLLRALERIEPAP